MAAINWLGSSPGHIQYGDFLFGPGTVWKWDELEGWEDTPGIDSGTVLKASDHGAWPGTQYAQARTITVNLIVKTEPGSMSGAVRQLSAATPIDRADEIPLVVQLDDDAPLVVFARCTRRALTVNRSNRVGFTRGSIQWEASDPRRYTLAESQVITGLPQPEAGLSFPLGFPLPWGAAGATGNVSAANHGDAPAHPAFVIKGPCTTPSVTNLVTGDVLEYDLSLSASDVLYVDTGQSTVTLNGTQASRLYTATSRSVPEASFAFPPGVSSLGYRSNDNPANPASTLTVTWRSAYW